MESGDPTFKQTSAKRAIHAEKHRNICLLYHGSKFTHHFDRIARVVKIISSLKSQIATSSRGGLRKQPFVFTEFGVFMLSSVFNSEKSIHFPIQIRRICIKVRQLLRNHLIIKLEIEEIKKPKL